MVMASGFAPAFRVAGLAGRIILLALVLATVLVAVSPQGRTGVTTAMFVAQVIPAVPVKPLAWFTGEPQRLQIEIDGPGGVIEADVYIPDGAGPFGAILLFLGVNAAGRDDSRVVNLAGGLARTGRVVLVPWSEDMAAKRITVAEIDSLVAAFNRLSSMPFVDPERIGMGGFCVGASLATVAAQDPRIADRVRYVNFFGGYFDASDLVVSVASGSSHYETRERPWVPANLATEVVRIHLVDGVPNAADREVLERAFITGEAVTRAELDALTGEAETVLRLLSGTSRSEALVLVEDLPAETLSSLRDISPASGMDRLEARMLIMHDREDDLVPYQESRRLYDALDGRGDDRYTEFSFFSHVDPTAPAGPVALVTEGFRLFVHLGNVIGTP